MLYQLILIPLLGLFACGYIAHRPPSRRKGAMAAFDAAVIALAAAMCVISYLWIANTQLGAENTIWRVVMGTVSTFHVFPAVLLLGWYLRRRLFAADQRVAEAGNG